MLVYRVSGSVPIADVPVTELAGLRCRGQDLIPRGDLSAHGSPTALLLDHEFSVVCQDQGQIGLSGFVHVASMGHDGTESKGRGPVPQPTTRSAIASMPLTHSHLVICSVAGT